MHTSPERRQRHLDGKRLCAAFSTVAIAVTTVGIAPASATLGPGGVEQGRNITVFHNIDFIGAFGWPAGVPITVEVIRDGVSIGSATGPSVFGVEGLALEVNHGPEGAPAPGDCWDGHTPDVRPGDLVRVTNSVDPTDIDEVIVDNITFSGPAYEVPGPAGEDGPIEVKGVALYADGEPIPVSALDSSEFRDDELRSVPDETVADPAVPGGFILRYLPPYELERNDDGLGVAARKASLLHSGGHATGFGHTEVLPPESMLLDGIADIPGPAPGCEAAPGAPNAVTTASTANRGFVNATDVAAGGNLTVGGSSFEATSVAVTLAGVTQTATPTGTGQQSWTTSFPMTHIEALGDGDHMVSMVATTATGERSGLPMPLTKDTEAPEPPTAAPAAGSYIGDQDVRLSSPTGDDIRYNLGGGAPTTRYRNAVPISAEGANTLKAVAVDPAGNASAALSGVYTITQPLAPAAPAMTTVTTGNGSVTATWRAPSFNGHSRITGYKVMADSPHHPTRSMVINDASRRSATMRGLVNGARYTISVVAFNALGDSPSSTRSRSVVPARRADSPVMGVASAGLGLARARWVAPYDNGGAAVTGYKLRVFRGNALARTVTVGRHRRAATVRGLVNGARYRFTVSAVNRVGDSAQSVFSNRVRPRSVPARPRWVRALKSPAGGRVTATTTWRVPRTNGGSRIDSYVVRVHRVKANGRLARPHRVAVRPARARSVTVRLRRAPYRFSVRAVNDRGRSNWSRLSNVRMAR